MSASSARRPRHAARRAVGAIVALLALLSATAPGVEADSPPDQVITFAAAPTGLVVGGTGFSVTATATSGLPVTYTSTTPGVCTVDSTSGSLALLAAGICTIAADQAGNIASGGAWAPAPQVAQSFEVGPAAPPGAFPALTVTADAKSRPFGIENPVLTATISGFVDGQRLETSDVTGSPACATTATLLSPAGAYPITCSIGTLASDTYSFAFVPGALTIVRGASSVTLSTTTTIFETSTPVTYTALVEPEVEGAQPIGSLVFVIDGAAQPAIPLDADGRGSVTVTWATPGVKSVDVSYAGDGSFAAPGTATAAPSVVANTARATGVGVSAATFYPIADGWRDAVTARGTRLEPLSVTITVRNALGGVVRTFAVPKAAGPYAWSWNGHRSNGTALPAGRYAIVQTLTDPYGSRPRAITTSNVTISLRRISWSRVVVVTGPGPRCFQFSTGDGVGGYSCGSTGTLRIAGAAEGWPGVGYQFRLPPASGYRSIRIELRGTFAGPRPTVGFHDWTLGSAWGQLYRPGWPRTAIAPTATRWSGVNEEDPDRFTSGRTVRAYVDGGGRLGSAFAFDITGIRLVVSVGTFQ